MLTVDRTDFSIYRRKRSAGDRFRGSSEIVERLSQAPRRSTTGMDAKVSSNIRSTRSASPSRTEEPDQDAVGNGFSSVEELREDSSNHDDVLKEEDLEWRAQGDDFRTFLDQFVGAAQQLEFPVGFNIENVDQWRMPGSPPLQQDFQSKQSVFLQFYASSH